MANNRQINRPGRGMAYFFDLRNILLRSVVPCCLARRRTTRYDDSTAAAAIRVYSWRWAFVFSGSARRRVMSSSIRRVLFAPAAGFAPFLRGRTSGAAQGDVPALRPWRPAEPAISQRGRIRVPGASGFGTADAQSVAGRWEATVALNGVAIPFRIELSGDGSNLIGWFFNGDDKVVSTGRRRSYAFQAIRLSRRRKRKPPRPLSPAYGKSRCNAPKANPPGACSYRRRARRHPVPPSHYCAL